MGRVSLVKNSVPKFRRESPEVRREALVEAALRCIAAHGYEGVSVRRIAAEAGVSVGLINHYYAGIDLLVAHAFESMAESMTRTLRERVEAAPPAPRARLTAFFEASFSPVILDPGILAVWVVFWSMLRHSPAIQQAQQRSWADYRAILENYLAAYAGECGRDSVNIGLAAMGLSALLDGCWLQWCLDPKSFRPEEGVQLCEAWVDALGSGQLSRLPPA